MIFDEFQFPFAKQNATSSSPSCTPDANSMNPIPLTVTLVPNTHNKLASSHVSNSSSPSSESNSFQNVRQDPTDLAATLAIDDQSLLTVNPPYTSTANVQNSNDLPNM